MESISTPRRSGLPWAVNLATLAVVVVTTWWSGAQRPVTAPSARAEQAVHPQSEGTPPSPQPTTDSHPAATEPVPLRVKADGSGATVATLGGGSLQTVSYKPVTR